MRRYQFLDKTSVYEAFNQLRNAFLAAKDGEEVDKIINAVLTIDERIRLGRRIQIAQCLIEGMTFDQIVQTLKVGKSTILLVEKQLDNYSDGFKLINKRQDKVDQTYHDKAWISLGGSKQVKKQRQYIGFRRGDVKR